MTTKEIFDEVLVKSNFFMFPLCKGFWSNNNYKMEMVNHNKLTGEINYNITYEYTPPKAVEYIELNFVINNDGSIEDINV